MPSSRGKNVRHSAGLKTNRTETVRALKFSVDVFQRGSFHGSDDPLCRTEWTMSLSMHLDHLGGRPESTAAGPGRHRRSSLSHQTRWRRCRCSAAGGRRRCRRWLYRPACPPHPSGPPAGCPGCHCPLAEPPPHRQSACTAQDKQPASVWGGGGGYSWLAKNR